MPYVLGVDIGTEGTKAVVVNEQGQISAKAYHSYSFDVPESGWAEQDPIVWWDAFRACLQDLWQAGIQPAEVRALGVAGQMHSSVLLDDTGTLVAKSILWNDGRTKDICEQVLDRIGRKRYQAETCNSLLPGFTLGKLLWVKDNLPEAFQRIHHVLMPKDYINQRLCGVYATDVTDASGTGVFDVRQRNWNEGLIAELGLPRTWFPKAFESGEVIGQVTAEASRETGLSTDTRIIAGAADNAAAAVGMGVVHKERGLVSVGTSGVILCCLDEAPSAAEAAVQNPTLHVFCHALPGMWYGMGVTLAAGASLKWFRDSLGSSQSYDALMEQAGQVKCGSNGLFYLPFLTGERTPYNSSQIRAAFMGAHMGHSSGHFVRSVVEGVSYSLKDCLEVVQAVTENVREFTVTGGAVKSQLWLQVLSDILNAGLIVPNDSEGAALGVAYLAGLAQGQWATLDEVLSKQHLMQRIQPSSHSEFYLEQYELYKTYATALYDVSRSLGR